MAVTKFGIIYAIGSGQIRRYIYPTHNDSEIDSHPPGPGEALTTCGIGPYPNSAAWLAAVNAAVTAAAGKSPSDPRCAVVDGNGKVVAIIMADPAIDSYPDGTLIAAYSPAIGIGCTYDSGSGLFTIPASTLPAGTFNPKTGTTTTQDETSPAQVIPRP